MSMTFQQCCRVSSDYRVLYINDNLRCGSRMPDIGNATQLRSSSLWQHIIWVLCARQQLVENTEMTIASMNGISMVLGLSSMALALSPTFCASHHEGCEFTSSCSKLQDKSVVLHLQESSTLIMFRSLKASSMSKNSFVCNVNLRHNLLLTEASIGCHSQHLVSQVVLLQQLPSLYQYTSVHQ